MEAREGGGQPSQAAPPPHELQAVLTAPPAGTVPIPEDQRVPPLSPRELAGMNHSRAHTPPIPGLSESALRALDV